MRSPVKFWSAYFKYYDVLLQLIPYRYLMSDLAERLALNEQEIVLDAGCGTGNINYFIPENIKVISLDQSEQALCRLVKKFPAAQVQQASLTGKLNFPDNTFDKIVTNNVLYTIPSGKRGQVLIELKRVLKPGGDLITANLTTQFKPWGIYKQHIRVSIKTMGLFKTAIQLLTLIFPTLMMFYYNRQIIKKHNHGAYQFFSPGEQSNLFINNGWLKKGQTLHTYAGQAELDVFSKVKYTNAII